MEKTFVDGSQTAKFMNVFSSKFSRYTQYNSAGASLRHGLTQVDLCELWPLRGWAVLVEGIDDLLLGLSDAVTVEHLDGDVISALWLNYTLH